VAASIISFYAFILSSTNPTRQNAPLYTTYLHTESQPSPDTLPEITTARTIIIIKASQNIFVQAPNVCALKRVFVELKDAAMP